jgi:hypothetical protein
MPISIANEKERRFNMSISGISSNGSLNALYKRLFQSQTDSSNSQTVNSGGSALSDSGSKPDSIKTDFSSLLEALQSGNVSSAQGIYSQLLQDIKDVSSSKSTDSTTSTTSGSNASSNPLMQDLNKLGDALSSGDLTSAQSILNNIMQHMQGAPPPPPDFNTSSNSGNDNNSLVQDLSKLGDALSSGDTTSAQSIYSQLMQDIQNMSSDNKDNSTSSATAKNSTAGNNFILQLEQYLSNWSTLSTSTQTSSLNISA